MRITKLICLLLWVGSISAFAQTTKIQSVQAPSLSGNTGGSIALPNYPLPGGRSAPSSPSPSLPKGPIFSPPTGVETTAKPKNNRSWEETLEGVGKSAGEKIGRLYGRSEDQLRSGLEKLIRGDEEEQEKEESEENSAFSYTTDQIYFDCVYVSSDSYDRNLPIVPDHHSEEYLELSCMNISSPSVIEGEFIVKVLCGNTCDGDPSLQHEYRQNESGEYELVMDEYNLDEYGNPQPKPGRYRLNVTFKSKYRDDDSLEKAELKLNELLGRPTQHPNGKGFRKTGLDPISRHGNTFWSAKIYGKDTFWFKLETNDEGIDIEVNIETPFGKRGGHTDSRDEVSVYMYKKNQEIDGIYETSWRRD